MSAQGVVNAALRKRIERLESLLKRALAASSAALTTTFAGPVVANEAAAAAFPLSDAAGAQAQVFVLSHRSIWTKRNGVAGVQGVPPLSPHEVIAATAGPVGVLCRTDYSDPALRVGINDIFIDPANGAASDENDGLTALTPLATAKELFRRWGWGASQPLVGPNLTTSPDGFTNIHIQSDVVAPDALQLKITIAQDSSLRVRGALLAANILRTSTLTDAVTAMNPALPAPGGTRLTIRDNTLLNWAAFEVANRRIRFLDGTAGPGVGHNGGTLQVQTDNLATPGQVQCTACQGTNEPGFSQVPTTLTPSVGDTYVVEQLVKCNMGLWDIDEVFNPFGFDIFVNIVDLNIPAAGQGWNPRMHGKSGGPFINVYQCTIDRAMEISYAGAINFVACYFTEILIGIDTGGFAVNGGGANKVATTVTPLMIFENGEHQVGFDFNFVANQFTLFLEGGSQSSHNFASWNVPAAALGNLGGHGIIVGFKAGFGRASGNVSFTGLAWGQGNAGVGLYVSAASYGVGAAQNITGGAGDLKLCESLVGWWWNAATAVYNPVGAGIALSWANIAAAKGVAGFGGSAHEPDQSAHWILPETTA